MVPLFFRIFFGCIEPPIFAILPGFLSIFGGKKGLVGTGFFEQFKDDDTLLNNPSILFLFRGYGLVLIVLGTCELLIFLFANAQAMTIMSISLLIGDILHISVVIHYFKSQKEVEMWKNYSKVFWTHNVPTFILGVVRIVFLILYWDL